jgi:hypothetical protein
MDTRDYMRARMRLSQSQEVLAKKAKTVEAWNLVSNHLLEMLRLCSGDNNGLRFILPFILLRVNRDDDAYCFCRYWILQGINEEEVDYSETKEGDWIYPRQENARFLDICKECGPEALGRYSALSTILSLAVIKMRLVAASTDPEVQGEQRRQLDQLLENLQANNASILPALVNPSPLLSQASPQFYSPGSPEEAYFTLTQGDVVELWNDIPGAKEVLIQRLGTSTPSYPTRMK